jgi:hypothetical protein
VLQSESDERWGFAPYSAKLCAKGMHVLLLNVIERAVQTQDPRGYVGEGRVMGPIGQ